MLCACVLVCLPACLSACLPACRPVCLPACLPVCLPACLLACLPACLPACPACLLVSLPVLLFFLVPACAPARPSSCLPVSPSRLSVARLLVSLLLSRRALVLGVPARLGSWASLSRLGFSLSPTTGLQSEGPSLRRNVPFFFTGCAAGHPFYVNFRSFVLAPRYRDLNPSQNGVCSWPSFLCQFSDHS